MQPADVTLTPRSKSAQFHTPLQVRADSDSRVLSGFSSVVLEQTALIMLEFTLRAFLVHFSRADLVVEVPVQSHGDRGRIFP